MRVGSRQDWLRVAEGVWGGILVAVMLGRSAPNGAEVWSHLTSWTVMSHGVYFVWTAWQGAVELRLMLMLPLLMAFSWMVAIAVVFMTAMEAQVLVDAEQQYGRPMTYVGNFGLHGWTLLLLLLHTTIAIEDSLRKTHLTYLRQYTEKQVQVFYWYSLYYLGSIILWSYFSWFDPTRYYGVPYLTNPMTFAFCFGTLWSALAGYAWWVALDPRKFD
jgi:hypothetical protein